MLPTSELDEYQEDMSFDMLNVETAAGVGQVSGQEIWKDLLPSF